MPVFCEKKGHKLRVYGVDVPEFPLEEPADESAIYRGVVAWEMYVFYCAKEAFEIFFQFFDLSGLSCPVQAFNDYKHVFSVISTAKIRKICPSRHGVLKHLAIFELALIYTQWSRHNQSKLCFCSRLLLYLS